MSRVNLIELSNQVLEDMQQNQTWFEREVSFVIDGSHASGYNTYKHICDTIDTSKSNYGKRGSNLVAFVGLQSLEDIYSINRSQALKVWNYFDSGTKKYYDKLVRDYLTYFENQLQEV